MTATPLQGLPDDALTRDILATLMPGFAGFTAPAWLADAFAAGMHAACVYGNNVESRAQLTSLGTELRSLSPVALLAIDEEGGEVTRLSYREGSPHPGAAVLGRVDDARYSAEIGARVARDILAAGFNLALGPVADVNSNPANPVIGTRSFGAAPALAARHVGAWVRGLETAGAVACPKHFPGHGDTEQDSHLELPTVAASRELLTERDLPPFEAAFAAGARAVMTSHIVLTALDPGLPATFSPAILQGILRGELGFRGVIVSDALDMQGASGGIGIPEAALRALAAGCDLLCLGVATAPGELTEIVSHINRAAADGRLNPARITEAAGRVRALAAAAAPAAAQGSAVPSPGDPRDCITALELARIIASFAGGSDALAWLRDHPGAAVCRVDADANMAVGFAPWGPFAAAEFPFPGQHETARAFLARDTVSLPELTTDPPVAPTVSGSIIIGRDLHRDPATRTQLAALRQRGAPLLIIEMGWPLRPHQPATSDYAEISTYGSSALVGAALLALMESAAS